MSITIKGKNGASAPMVLGKPKNEYHDHLTDDGPPKASQSEIKGILTVEHIKTLPGGQKILLEASEEEIKLYGGKPIPLGALHNLSVGGERTLNLQNYGGKPYESVKIFCALTVPTTKPKLEEAWEFASDFISNKINDVVAKTTGKK